MNNSHIIKSALLLSIGLFALLVTYNNVMDYGSNFSFVQHVLLMDTTFDGNQLKSRAIENPIYHHAFYIIIITTEGLVSIMCLLASWYLLKSNSTKAYQNSGNKWANYGLTLGIVLWFSGFITIGGEWFLMWQSQIWNGQQSAFRFVVILFLTLIFVNQKEKPESEGVTSYKV